jgi:hypothetical protein
MKRLHIYLTYDQYTHLSAYAKAMGCSMSRALRGLVPMGQETIRGYVPDGGHTALQRDIVKMNRILAKMR